MIMIILEALHAKLSANILYTKTAGENLKCHDMLKQCWPDELQKGDVSTGASRPVFHNRNQHTELIII